MANDGDDEGLEKAIDDFAGPAADGQPIPPSKPRQVVDCLIVGFEPDGNRDFKSLILAAEVDGKLSSVGSVSAGIAQEVRDELNQQLRKLQRPEPFVPNHYAGIWVQPKLVCRVSAAEWSSNKRLVEPVFQQLLAEIPVARYAHCSAHAELSWRLCVWPFSPARLTADPCRFVRANPISIFSSRRNGRRIRSGLHRRRIVARVAVGCLPSWFVSLAADRAHRRAAMVVSRSARILSLIDFTSRAD